MEKPRLSYEFYYNTYSCGEMAKIPQNEFSFYARLADEEISSECTCDIPEAHEDALKLCMCEVAEALYLAEKHGNVKSENIDGYSVTYGERPALKREVQRIILKHLASTGALYKGVEKC